jgi:hypothetical protein
MKTSRRGLFSWLLKAGAALPFLRKAGAAPVAKRYGSATAYSRQLVVQSTMDLEAMVRPDLAAIVARKLDRHLLERR